MLLAKKLVTIIASIFSIILLIVALYTVPCFAIPSLNITVVTSNQIYSIESCDSAGNLEDVFHLDETVYMNGSGYLSNTTFDFYIVSDVITWINGTPIPTRIPGTVANISSNSLGNISPTPVWNVNLTIGMYDAIVDVNGNGFYDESIDALDDTDILFAGFMIPYEGPPEWIHITVATDNPLYGLSHPISITGNLTSNNGPLGNALVALEVRDSADIPLTFRTKSTGPSPIDNWPINFTQIFTSDSNGNPKSSFQKNKLLWIHFTIKNHGTVPRNVLVCLGVYDENMVPIMADYGFSTYLQAGQSVNVTKSIDYIPNWASYGNAIVFGNIYSELPKNGGYPHCSEQQTVFLITNSSSSSIGVSTYGSPYISETLGTYNLTFKLPPEARVGIYTVFASSYYYGLQDDDSSIFEVELIGDINDDGWVELTDFFLLSLAFGSTPEDPNWDPRCDIAPWPGGDDVVELLDWYLVSQHIGEHVPGP